MGFVFVPLTTATMGDLPNEQMGNATGIFNLMRNIGGGIGISLATTLVARGAQAHQAMMVGHLTPYDPQFQQYIDTTAHGLSHYGDPVAAGQQAYGLLGGMLGGRRRCSPTSIRSACWPCCACCASRWCCRCTRSGRTRGPPPRTESSRNRRANL